VLPARGAGTPIRVDLGCGRRPVPGAFGVDATLLPGVAAVARLDAPHLPFQSETVDHAYALNVLEHLDDLAGAMAEVHRVLAPGGRLTVEVPYFTSPSAFADPTHRRWFTYTTFEHFAVPPTQGWQANRHTWFGAARFRVTHRHLHFGKLHRALGAGWLANRFPSLYENFLAHVIPARALTVELEPA
jgi:SAM-dependent methyltransferase